jgi:hypothetical protein
VPTALFTATPSNTAVLSGGFTKEQNFTFDLSSDSDTTRYQLKYWNMIDGSAFNGAGNAWTSSDISSTGHMSTLGTYTDNFTQGQGTHFFVFSACDLLNHCSDYSSPFLITYDATKPTYNIANNSTHRTANLDVVVTEKNIDTIKLDGATVATTGSGPDYTVSVSGEGSHTILATDKAGNSAAITFTLDTTGPTYSVSYSPSGWTSGNVVATITTNESIETPSGWNKVSDTEYTKEYAANGSYTVTLQDKVGNTTTATVVIDNIDRVFPVFNIANGSLLNTSSVQVAVTESNIATITVDGIIRAYTTAGAATYGVIVSGEGAHTVVATDAAGNSSTVTFTIDSKSPVVSIENVGRNTDGSYTITGTSDDTTDVLVSIDGATPRNVTVVDGEWSFTTDVLAPGDHTIDATSTDIAGNVGNAERFSFEAPGTQAFRAPVVALGDEDVLGDENDADTANVVDTSKQEVKGTSDVTDDGFSPLGLAWYWWLLILAGVAALLWAIAAARRRAAAEDA